MPKFFAASGNITWIYMCLDSYYFFVRKNFNQIKTKSYIGSFNI
jgi:hypothetical protein